MKANIQDIHGLAPSQHGMLLESTNGLTQGDMFIEQSVLLVRGKLDTPRFLSAVEQIATIHSSLRSCFAWEGETPLHVVFDKVRPVVEWEDWQSKEGADDRQTLEAWLAADRSRGLAVNRAPLWRFTVIRCAEEVHRVIWTHHHLITDGWSIAVVLNDLLDHYKGLHPVPAARPLRDYIDWVEAQDRGQAIAFWRQRVQRLPRLPPMPPRAHEHCFVEIDGIDVRGILDTARKQKVAFATVAFAAWALVLRASRSSDEVVFGITVHGRPAEIVGVERMVGPFIATFPMYLQMAHMSTTEELLHQIEQQQSEQRPFEYLSAAEVHQAGGIATRLYDSLVVVEQIPQHSAMATGGISVSAESGNGARSHHPLLLRFSQDGMARLMYNKKFFDDETASGLVSLLRQAAVRLASNDGLVSLDGAMAFYAPIKPRPVRMPRNQEEHIVLSLARTLFGEHATLDDNFIDLGGHSLLAVQFIQRIAHETGVQLPITQFLQDDRLSSLAKALGDSQAGVVDVSHPRILFVPGNPGTVLYASRLSVHLVDWRLHGLEAPGLDGSQPPLATVEALAEHHLASLSVDDNPTVIIGHSFGGWVAFEMGLRLQARGREAVVILLDTVSPYRLLSRGDVSDEGLRAEVEHLKIRAGSAGINAHITPAVFEVYVAARRAIYAPAEQARFPMMLFRASQTRPEDTWDKTAPDYGWGELCQQLHVDTIEGDHLSIMVDPATEVLARRIERWLYQLSR
uniref:Nonribosomal peptide synthetase SpiE2 n=1 Tax=Pseudomonas sp. Q71576 TaxID=1231908 RepID=V5IZJ4_9PSED|nr:nonribosomal peptide synthetase SpiE2 [Pseudomonas sp. Q71576]